MRTETHIWNYLYGTDEKRLLGRRWTRLESRGTTRGPGDAFGFFRGETHWIELKIDPPSLNRLRPSQYEFALDCIASKVPVWCCFAHQGRLVWIRDLNFSVPTRPIFYRGKR